MTNAALAGVPVMRMIAAVLAAVVVMRTHRLGVVLAMMIVAVVAAVVITIALQEAPVINTSLEPETKWRSAAIKVPVTTINISATM